MAHRGLVVSSPAAMARAEARLTTAPPRAWDAREPPRVPWPANRVPTPEAAPAALTALSKSWRSQPLDPRQVIDHTRDAGHGRPPPTSPLQAMAWPMPAQVRPAQEVLAAHPPPRACWVSGTPSQARQGSAAAVSRAEKAHSGVEGGCRWLTDPWGVVSSRLVKNPRRMHGGWLVMTWALLGSALTPRRWRQP